MTSSESLLRNVLITHKFLHFFVTGTVGVMLNLVITWALTTFVFGINGYFTAYLIGTGINLLFNFTIHTVITFQTHTRHFTRLALFILYNIFVTMLQAMIIKYLTAVIGVQYYLVIIASVILIFSIGNFVIFKFLLFHERRKF